MGTPSDSLNSDIPQPAPARIRVLVVDDDAGIRGVTTEMLTLAGYQIETASDGSAALTVIDTFKPDLVITDLQMPRMSGFELLEILRERFPAMPVIATSGDYSGDALPPGVIADLFLAKTGVNVSRLRTAVAELLSISPMRTRTVPRPAEDHRPIDCDADMMAVFGRLAKVEKVEKPMGLGSELAWGNGHLRAMAGTATPTE